MEADRNRPDRRRTTPSPRVTDAPVSAALGVPDAEAFDRLKRHDPSLPAASAADRMARWRGDEVRWVRASDALAQSSGRATGRGIVWTAQANRLPRRAPRRQTGTGRRAIARASATSRASPLAPLTVFGARPDPQPSAARTGVSR